MISASATKLGELGAYLKCIRIVNSTNDERVANYALLQFRTATTVNKEPLTLNYGVCLPKACDAASVRWSFEHDVPLALEQTEEVVTHLSLALAQLASVLAQVHLENTTFDELSALLRNGSMYANATGFPKLERALGAAARAVGSAGRLHDQLERAESFLDGLNRTAADQLSAALSALDRTLEDGPRALPWPVLLFALEAELVEAR